MRTRPSPLIERPRLQQRLAAAPVALLEAPGGYGKSTLYTQLAAALDMATVRVVLTGTSDRSAVLSALAAGCRRSGLATLAASVDSGDPDGTLDRLVDRLRGRADPVLLAVDEVHRADPQAAEWLAMLAHALPEGVRLVIAGRRLGPVLAAVPRSLRATYLGVDDLRFDVTETATAVEAFRGERPGEGEAAMIHRSTDGWPAAVVLAAVQQAAHDAGVAAGVAPRGGPVLRRLVDGLLAAADPRARELFETAARLPLLSAAVLAVVGGDGSLDRLLETGIPVRFRPDGWGELPDPLRELVPDHRLPGDAARRVAALYAADGELVEAVTLLHRGRDIDGLAALIGEQRREVLERAGLALLATAVDTSVDAALARHPAAIVALVQSAERQPRLRAEWIARALRVLPDETPHRRAVEAEAALDAARAGALDDAEQRAATILSAARADEHATRGRAHLTHALCLLLRDTAGATPRVADDLEAAIAAFRLADERSWEAEAHQALGYGVHFTNGAYALAAERLERALALRPAADAARAATLTFVAEVLTHLGRLDDAEVALREATLIAHALADARTIAYAAWSTAELACQRRDRARAFDALAEAEAHPDGWFESLAGIDFLTHAATIRMMLGDRDGAARDLQRAEGRATGTARGDQPLAARARFEAVLGDARAALRHLDALDGSPLAYRSDRWLRLLLRAVAISRLGDAAAARELVRRAEQAAADLDDPEGPARREPELLAIAVPAAARPATTSAVSIVLLGRFGVERDGADVSPPPGRPATLVKLLALRGSLTTDEAIELLWPDADLDVGRARLRNLLNRIRQTSGDLVARRDGALALAPSAVVDAERFETEAAAALAAPPAERPGLARRALARAAGELLPADRYEDWSTVARERVRRRQLALLDLVAEDAMARGDLDEAERLLDAAIATDPLEEVRHVRLATALLGQGRTRAARRVAEQAIAVADELGVEPGDELRSMLGELAKHT